MSVGMTLVIQIVIVLSFVHKIGNLHPCEPKYTLSLFNDTVAGLEHAKKCVTEMVIWPLLRPDIFKGCRSPGRGLLLFGPPVSATFSS